MSRRSAHAHVHTARPHLYAVPRGAEAAVTVDTTPRPMRGILLATALALPLWGAIGLAVHALWNVIR